MEQKADQVRLDSEIPVTGWEHDGKSDMAESESGDSKMTWQERETSRALERLASARANLATLEEQAAGPANRLAGVDPTDLATLDELDAERRKLEPKANSRFGGAAARERLDEIALKTGLILERVGFASYEELAAERDRPVAPAAEVDPVILEFARREVADAEAAFIEIVSLELPPTEAEESVDDEEGEPAPVVDLRSRTA